MVSQAPMAGANLTAALCKKSNRVARVLAYALLEWILIALLLANGVFSYLISRFAAFFGLAPPCALCSRLGVDSLFERHAHRGVGGAEPLRRVLCDAHAAELSCLGYCSAHRRLADAGDMCEDCAAAAAPGKALLSWMGRSELGERDLACACCGVALESGFYSPPFLLPTPAKGGTDCGNKEEEEAARLNGDVVFVSEEGPVIELFDEKPLLGDDSISVLAHGPEIVANVERLVPLESIDSLAVDMGAVSSQSGVERKEAVDHVRQDNVVMENMVNANEEKIVMTNDDDKGDGVVDRLIDEQIADIALVPACMEGTFDDVINAGKTVEGFAEHDTSDHEFVEKLDRSIEVEHFQQAELKQKLNLMTMVASAYVAVTQPEEKQVHQAEVNQELGSIPIQPREHSGEELEGERAAQAGLEQECDSMPIDSGEHACMTSYACTDDEQVEMKQKVTLAAADVPDLDKFSPNHTVTEEERDPETPTHIEGICDSQELLDSKAAVSDAKSVDSSVATMTTDLESTEFVSVDQLKSALASARKSLNSLYAELENERNAAAIAADETMAMINRLQEQKAAMQMEAIQYQRLMEEQSEYDQEALQRLNELVVKREKEKQDLERELELYRHKVHLYEAKVRKMSRHKADDQNGSSSASSSAEDSDDLSQSFYEGDESAHGLNGSNGSIPTDVVLQETARHLVTLDGSLADFEEERLSILEQLKVLEDKLFDLDDEESNNMKTDKHFSEEHHLSGASNGFSDDESCFKLHDKRKSVTCRGKKLLPLFDDATVGARNIVLTKQGDEADHSTEVTLDLAREQDKLAIAHEIDQVHERLHALEADREYIKQCVRSLKKGGKGFDLLQEILQHLRDLRRIEQRARNSGELSPHYLHLYTD
uniref:GTD-binding domain-containing protein n=1 Tax=Setaria italica TaxID=4555 RepID=K4A5M4_SETIT